MLSILIPTYNYPIGTLVASLHKQLQSLQLPYEILVADDASTNKEIVEENREIRRFAHCKYLEQTENQGRTATRNFLAKQAAYDWLLFLDADVLPATNTFIEDFNLEQLQADIVFGGITYTETPPQKEKILRWKYGRSREVRPISERNKQPYLALISGCSLIRKGVFLKANNFYENRYGLDVLFTFNLQKLQARVLHIDNPVVHYGLENSKSFVKKSKEAVASIAYFEKEGLIPNNFRPIQKAYLKLKKWKLVVFFYLIMQLLYVPIEKTLLTSRPSLFLFDILRLYYFISLKRNSDA